MKDILFFAVKTYDAAPVSGDALVLLEKVGEGSGTALFFVKNTAKELDTAMNAAIENR